MKIEFEGVTRQLDLQDIRLKEAFVISSHMGLTLNKWEDKLTDLEALDWPKAVGCLYWLMLQQNGDVQPVADVDFALLSFYKAFAAAATAEAVATGTVEPDPTKPAGEPEEELMLPPVPAG